MHTLLMPAAAARSHATHSGDHADLALMLLGPSAAMGQLWKQVRRLAPHARTVLLTGQAESGQEAVARLLLDFSPWPQRQFLALSGEDAEDRLARSSALSVVPNEIFLFLSDLDRLSPAAQEGLLRLLRLRRSRGFAVAAATTEDLGALVSMGRFSAELAEAFNAVRIGLPSLKERVEDLPMLLSQMLAMRCQTANRPVPQVSEEFLRAAMQHAWPGNFHELSGVVDGLLATVEPGHELSSSDLKFSLKNTQIARPAAQPVRMVKLNTVVEEHIFSVLRACRGNKLRAAETLGISRSTLYRMLDASAQNTTLPLAS